MKPACWLFKRGNKFYFEDARTGKQTSLRTSDLGEAERLIAAKNEAANKNSLALAVGQVYLSAIDPALLTRIWADVMKIMVQRGGPETQKRTRRALEHRAFEPLRNKVIHETASADFLAVLDDKKRSTLHYLKMLQSLTINLGWLAGRVILPKQCWPKIIAREKRAITWDEHQRIVESEKNVERRLFYEVLWETGASQTDAANLSRWNIDEGQSVLVYRREKTQTQASIKIGERLRSILKQLPAEGLLFPKITTLDSVARAAEFYRRCRMLGIKGISLHSYRYAWAERAFSIGYPERFAQAALGHESRAVHRAYARKAKVCCPALEDYQQKGN
jgi:integrase